MKYAVVDFDDFEDSWMKNGLNMLFYWKSRYPKFKATLFAIPGKTSKEMVNLIKKIDWLQLAAHGYIHDNNHEVQCWTEQVANSNLNYAETLGIDSKVFKAPGWQITYPQPYNETPDSSKPVNQDPQLIYRILQNRGYIVADQHYNKDKRPEGLRVYCTCNPLIIHGHTWNMEQGEPNGLEQMQKAGVNWDWNTEFKLISELTDEELKCRY